MALMIIGHHENVISFGQLPASLYEMQKVKELPVNVSANLRIFFVTNFLVNFTT